MGNIFGQGIFSSLNDMSSVVTLTMIVILLLGMTMVVKITGLPFLQLVKRFMMGVGNVFGGIIKKKEIAYHRDIEIGKINDKRKRVKLYRFLSDLIIDLDLTATGITPYELLYIVSITTIIVASILCKMILGSLLIATVMAPLMVVAVFCVMYTKANVAHDARIEAVIEAENIICNNIKIGVVAAVRDSLNVLPKQVRVDFKDFLDNVEFKNYHIKTALEELNMRLGGIADDFIKKCIVFEIEEEHGIAGMFADVVEVNNIRMETRIEMKRRFEEVTNQFKIGASMIFIFLFGVLAIYKDVRDFYFQTFIGQLILALDAMLLIAEYVFITYLRAQEL